MAHDAVTDLESRHACAYLDHFARAIAAEYVGELHPGANHPWSRLNDPVDRVYGDGVILDDDLVL
jgi:hypothetical protein